MAPASKRMRSGAVLNSTLLLGCDVSTPLPKSSKSKRFRAKEESKKQLDEHFWDTSINNSPHNSSLGHDLIELFCEPRTGTKSKSPKRKKNKLKHVQSFDLDLLDRPMTTKSVGGRSNIEGVFDEFLKKDPFASLGKFVLTERQPSPDRPLTLFSPVKDQPRTFSAPQNRVPEEGRLKATESHIERWTSKAVASAKRELILDGRSPLYRRRLDAAAYSPCPNSKAMSGRKIDAWSCMNGPAEWSTCSPQPSISTPVAQSRLFKTPSAPKCQSIPGEPLSGVKSLFQEESFFAESPISIAGTPRHFDSSHPSFMSPAYVERPDSVKQTLLLGVTCYVEVKYNKEDRSESIRKEVISLGAKVEKNFTKRVTHVIFKGGKMSTYIKAKEMKIPIVSLLWLEACKVVGNMVDPEIYPPADNVEYEKNVPIEEDKKRERFLRRGQAFLDRLNGVLPAKPPRTRSNKKKAVTEGKKKSPRITAKIVGARRKMPKKLNFNPSSGNRRVNDSDSDYESETDCDVNNDACRDKPERRKSAPATLGDVEKPTDGKQRTANAEIEKDGFETPTRRREQKTQEDLLKILTGGGVTAEKRRRKLFDPNESLMSQPLLATPEDMSPYLKPSPARSKSRTTSSKRSQKVKELKRLGGARKSLAPLIEHEEESLSVSTSRNSLGCFELDKKTKYSTKDRPRIAFTGLPKDEIARFKKIVSRLGSFEIDSTVSKKTTHLVTLSKPVVRRTINLLKALARGCWILDVEWLNHSNDSNKWMSEEPFELKSFSEAVVQCRLEKQAFGKHYAMDLFSGFGSIFVDSSAQAPRSDLIELIKICSGKVVNVSSKADIIVSSRPLDDSNPEVTFVSHLWVLDSITKNKVLDVEQYKIPLCFVQPSA